MTGSTKRRRYRLKKRAESQAETRRRIVSAIVSLHEEVGPARTTVSAIAERAGVERLTVYRHFPDEMSQFVACSAHWSAEHQSPDPLPWRHVADPPTRLRQALLELYCFYRRGEPMLRQIMRDTPLLPNLQQVIQPFSQYLADVADLLAEDWSSAPHRRPLLNAAIAHAIQFQTWQSLCREQNLSDNAAAELMTHLAAAAAEPINSDEV